MDSISDIVSKFKNGRKLYDTSPVFHHLIHSIANGLSMYDAIEILIDINIKDKHKIEECLTSKPQQIIVDCKDNEFLFKNLKDER